MQLEKARNARIRAQLDRLKAQYVREDETLRVLLDAAGIESVRSIEPRRLVPNCAPAPVAALRA